MTRLLAMAFALPLAADLLDRFIAKRALRLEHDMAWPRMRWIAWGVIVDDSRLWTRRDSDVRFEHEIHFFRMTLPFLDWRRDSWDWGNRERWCWHRMVLVWRSEWEWIPKRQGPGWRLLYEPVEEQPP